jgi:hypothetical protein
VNLAQPEHVDEAARALIQARREKLDVTDVRDLAWRPRRNGI